MRFLDDLRDGTRVVKRKLLLKQRLDIRWVQSRDVHGDVFCELPKLRSPRREITFDTKLDQYTDSPLVHI